MKLAVVLAHLNGRLVARQVHDFLLGQEELVERGVDHGLSSPHVVDRLRPNATNPAPVNHCFLSNFLTYILVAESFFSGFIVKTMEKQTKLILSLGKNRISTIPRGVFSFRK